VALLISFARRDSRRRGFLGAALALLVGLLAANQELRAQPEPSREYQIKAVFLFNFVQFVDWPPQAFAGPESPVVIGVLGEDPFGPALDEAVRGENVNGRPLVVHRFRRIEDVGLCHVLYVSRSETSRLPQIMTRLKGRSILTVSDTDEFTRLSGIIRFVTENNKVRLRINVDAAKAADLTISSKLLRPAEIISSGGT